MLAQNSVQTYNCWGSYDNGKHPPQKALKDYLEKFDLELKGVPSTNAIFQKTPSAKDTKSPEVLFEAC